MERARKRVVAVVGLAPGCGATTLARALAVTLARRDGSGSAIVAGSNEHLGSTLAVRAATRVARTVASSHTPARAAGRLCLASTRDHEALACVARDLAPLVLDVAPGELAAVASSVADLTIVVAPAESEPALADLAARSFVSAGTPALTVVSRSTEDSRWHERAFLLLPESRVGARIAAAGWEPRGALGRAVARIADACSEAACG